MFWINRLFMNNIFVMFDYILYFINEYSAAIGIIITIIGAVCFYKKYDYTKKRDLEFYGNQEILKKRQEAYIKLYKFLNILQCKEYFSIKNKQVANLINRVKFSFFEKDLKEISKNKRKIMLDKTISNAFCSYKFILKHDEFVKIVKNLDDIHINDSMFFSKDIFSKYIEFLNIINMYYNYCNIFYYFLFGKSDKINSKNPTYDEIKLLFICFFEKEIQNKIDLLKNSLTEELNSSSFILNDNNVNDEDFNFDKKFDDIFNESKKEIYENFLKEYIKIHFYDKKLKEIENRVLEYDNDIIKPYNNLITFLNNYMEEDS